MRALTLRRPGGFSFVELLASLAILGLLASLAMPLAQVTVRRDKERELRRALRDIRAGLDAYKTASADGRIATGAGDSGYPARLEDLAQGVPDIKTEGAPTLYLLRRIPRDPFHPDKTLPAAQTWGLRSFASPPEAPVKGDDVFDVYSQSIETGLNGVPYKEW